MSKRHDKIFDDVLKDFSADIAQEKPGTRFLKRSNALADSGEREEKVLRWVDPAICRMWERHNRAYELLNEENCRDLIDSLRAQGQQEFPAIVRRVAGGAHEYEVICGARRHFAVSWLRANNYPQFRYLVEMRDLTDEEAFRLSDIENRDREDLSDYERARDYLQALELYYGGKQKTMAARLDVSEGWLSRYLYLARLPEIVVRAWPCLTEIKELHARTLRPLLATDKQKVLTAAEAICAEQEAARKGQGGLVPAARVLTRLKAAVQDPAPKPVEMMFGKKGQGVRMIQRGPRTVLDFKGDMPEADLRKAMDAFFAHKYHGK